MLFLLFVIFQRFIFYLLTLACYIQSVFQILESTIFICFVILLLLLSLSINLVYLFIKR